MDLIVRTKMSTALLKAVAENNLAGKSAGRVGRRAITNMAKDVGVKFQPRTNAVKTEALGKNNESAESAGITI